MKRILGGILMALPLIWVVAFFVNKYGVVDFLLSLFLIALGIGCFIAGLILLLSYQNDK